MNSLFHFYLTFNPYLNQQSEPDYTQAHEFYDLLRELVHIDKNATCYWGKMISKEREARVDFAKLQHIFQQNKEQQFSTHLYISDFQNLWVGKIKSITQLLPKNANTLSFYKDKKVEVWFEIEDFILLEHGHSETAKRLKDFHLNQEVSGIDIKGLSPFTTGIKYPCIVEDQKFEQYFDEYDSTEISHLVLKENPNIHRSNTQQVLRALNSFVFPEELYGMLPHAAKIEIETAEMDILEQRHHNLHKIAFSYLKAMEVVMNDLIIHHIKKKGLAEEFFVDIQSAPPKLLLHPSKSDAISLKEFNKNFSLAHLLNFVEFASNQNHMGFKKAFADHKDFIRYLTKDFADIVRGNHLIEIRNALAHGENEKLSEKDAFAVRNIILGVGAPGILAQCYLLLHKEKLAKLFSVTDFKSDGQSNQARKLKLVS